MKTALKKDLRLLPVLLLLVGLLCTGCSQSRSKTATREVTDMAGRTMLVPDTIKRVFTTHPGSIILYAVDPGLSVCRTLQISKYAKPFLKPEYIDLPYTDGSPEEIVKLKPDIIISCFDINDKTKDDADKLSKKTGIPVFQVEIDMENYSETFDVLGDLLNRHQQTDRMKAFVHTYLDTITERAKRIPEKSKVRIYYAEGEKGLATDPSGSKHSQIIDLVGAINVAQATILPGSGMTPVSMEQILLWNPDQILCWTGSGVNMSTYSAVTKGSVWKKVPAVRKKQVYQIPFLPFGWFDRPPGTNRILGAIWTAHLLYPKIYPFDMKAVTKEYFEIFYHRRLSEKELEEVLFPKFGKMTEPAFKKPLKH